jgi:hypothetical protein
MKNENETVDLEQIRLSLEAWRGQRERGGRIPQELWRQAASAVAQHGLKRVSETLRLNYAQLRRRASVEPRAAPVFVELKGAPAEEPGVACVVELEKGNGTRLRIQAREAVGVDWGKVKEAFLGT